MSPTLLVQTILSFITMGPPQGPSSECDGLGLDAASHATCTAYCDLQGCGEAPDGPACASLRDAFLEATGSSALPCDPPPPTCACVDPQLLLERISLIEEPDYICYADTDQDPYSYVEYIVESGGVPQIGMGLEDDFDGTWYCYYFEYQGEVPGALPEVFRYDLTAADADACRAAFEPPFACPG